MNKLSEKQVKTLNDAIDKTMDFIDSKGCDPNAAIVKVAKDMHLTEDYIPVIVAAYNNGTQYAQRENGNSITTKTAKFTLADEGKIKSILYSGEEKTAGLTYASDDFFDYKPAALFNTDHYSSTLYSPTVKAASYKRESTTFKTEQRITEGVNTIVESVRMEKSAALDRYDDAIKDMAYYLRQYDAPSIPCCIKLANTVYGHTGVEVVKEAAMRFSLPLKAKETEPVVNVDSPFYKYCEACVDNLDKYNLACDEELESLKKCASALKPIVSRRVNELYKTSPLNDNSPAYFFEKKNKEFEVKQASPAKLLPSFLADPNRSNRGSLLAGSQDLSGLESLLRPQWRDLNPYEHNIMRSLDDPDHEAKLRDIVVGSNITDLINSDEYLSDKDPEEVIDAYNELMEIAPEIHNKKPLLRAALRQYMESGGIDVQSLGLIGDIGRKTESRKDESKRDLANLVEKALASSEDVKKEQRKFDWEREKLKTQLDVTVSEGRRNRSAQAEEARKQRSEQRKMNDAKLKADRWKALLEAATSDKDRNAKMRAERDKAKLSIIKDRSDKINDIVDQLTGTEGFSNSHSRNTGGGKGGTSLSDTTNGSRNMTLQTLNTYRNKNVFSNLSPDMRNNIVEHRRMLFGDDDVTNHFTLNAAGSYDMVDEPDVIKPEHIRQFASNLVDNNRESAGYGNSSMDNLFTEDDVTAVP